MICSSPNRPRFVGSSAFARSKVENPSPQRTGYRGKGHDEKDDAKPMGQVIQIDEGRIRDHLGEMVRGTVEEALNAMLDAGTGRPGRGAQAPRSASAALSAGR